MNNQEFFTDSPVHPGEHLRETIEELEITQIELANRTGISRKVINEILNGKNPITPKTAILLESVLGMPAHIWINLQRNYELNKAYLAEQKQLEKDSLFLKDFPVNKMMNYGWIPKFTKSTEKVKALYKFFEIASLDNLENSLAIQFRRSKLENVSKEATIAWLKKGEVETRNIETAPFSKSKLKKLLPAFRSLTRTKPEVFQPEIGKLCSETGVAAVFIPELPNTFINGAVFWFNSKKAAIMLSLRFKTNDHIWFSFFHELGHILLHGKDNNFIDLDGNILTVDQAQKEKEANKFAADLLIPPIEWDSFKYNSPFSKLKVEEFANKLDIAPGIVVGRLQKEGLIPYSDLNKLKERYRWI